MFGPMMRQTQPAHVERFAVVDVVSLNWASTIYASLLTGPSNKSSVFDRIMDRLTRCPLSLLVRSLSPLSVLASMLFSHLDRITPRDSLLTFLIR
jgi:hypothetical protein